MHMLHVALWVKITRAISIDIYNVQTVHVDRFMYSLNSWMQAWLLIYGWQQTVKLSGWAAAGILDALELHVHVVICTMALH